MGPVALVSRGGGGHSTLELTGVLGQQLKTRGLSVRDVSPKKRVIQWKDQKNRGQMVRIRQILVNFPGWILIWTHNSEKIENFDQML